MTKLLLVDGSSLIHRAFHALPPLLNDSGLYTNAVYGLIIMLNKIIEKEAPDMAVVCFDKSRASFRTRIAPDYKGTRKETPAELKGQFSLAKETLAARRITALEMDDYEADDLIGTLARAGEAAGFEVSVFSGDRDLLQLITDKITVFLTKKGISEVERWDSTRFFEVYELRPIQLIDLKALMGDSSDNIAGVMGVGEKTALKLIRQYESLEKLYQNLDSVEPAGLKAKLRTGRESAETSKILAAINTACPLTINWDNYRLYENDSDAVYEIYRRLGFRSLLARMPARSKSASAAAGVSPENTVLTFPPETDSADLDTVLRLAQETGECSLYFAWRGEPRHGDISAIGLSSGGKCFSAAYNNKPDKKALSPFAALFLDNSITKLCANAKESRQLISYYGWDIGTISGDPYIAAYLLERPADTLFEEEPHGSDPAGRAAYRAFHMKKLSQDLEEELEKRGLKDLYYGVEMPLTAVLANMETIGIRVRGDLLKAASVSLGEKMESLTNEIYTLCECEFNINSPKQLGEVLFNKMKLRGGKKTKTGWSTNADELERLKADSPAAALILDYRACAKLKSTYADGLLVMIDPVTERIHTTFKQTVTATGRLSSAEPNLQNIPVRTEEGRKLRRSFVPREGYSFIACDYNQIELRVLAHLSGDERLIEAYVTSEDIHTRTAAEIFGVSPKEINAESRRRAKAVNFGIVYGISDYGLSADLSISIAEAKEYIERYFARYPGVYDYQKQVVAEGRQKGYVSTLFGRRRYLPELLSSNYNRRSFAERMAINAPVQGTAADIIKIAMIAVNSRMRDLHMGSSMLLQVHDELIFEVLPEERNDLAILIKEQMEKAAALKVPLIADLKEGCDWYDMRPFDKAKDPII